MSEKHRARVSVLLMIGAVLAGVLVIIVLHYIRKPISITGAIVKQDSDTRKQSPVADVQVTVADHLAIADANSDFSGYFKITLRPGIKQGQAITLQFRQKDYEPVDLKTVVADKLYIVEMTPLEKKVDARSSHPVIAITNVFVRYSIESSTSVNIGTGIKTFQVVNTSNVPCDGRPPCSTNGRWKAATGSASLDAGEGNVYDDARLSCIAGPCPFTKIVSDGFSKGGRNIQVSVLDWSDTTTFLLQAEAFRYEVNDIVRESYPVIFGDSLNFTLPRAAEGPSLEAEVGGENIIFPLGPSPALSWANCNVRTAQDQSKTYRCELKPGYEFR